MLIVLTLEPKDIFTHIKLDVMNCASDCNTSINMLKFKSTLKCFSGSEPQCSFSMNYVNKILPEVFRDFNVLYLHSRAGIKLNR